MASWKDQGRRAEAKRWAGRGGASLWAVSPEGWRLLLRDASGCVIDRTIRGSDIAERPDPKLRDASYPVPGQGFLKTTTARRTILKNPERTIA